MVRRAPPARLCCSVYRPQRVVHPLTLETTRSAVTIAVQQTIRKPSVSDGVLWSGGMAVEGSVQILRCLLSVLLLASVCEAADPRDVVRTVYGIRASHADGRSALGSAVVIAPGKLVTSCHTTHHARRIFLLNPSDELVAHPGSEDGRHDLCILVVPEIRGPIAARLPSSALNVGEAMVAVGFTDGLSRFVQEGQVTALYRMDGGSVIRTSVAFPRGASGGGLFNSTGEVVGILTFRGTADDDLKYALPTEWVDRLLEADASLDPHGSELAFWEDQAPNQPAFLDAAWLESAQEWSRLRGARAGLDSVGSRRSGGLARAWSAKLGLAQPKEALLALRAAVPATAPTSVLGIGLPSPLSRPVNQAILYTRPASWKPLIENRQPNSCGVQGKYRVSQRLQERRRPTQRTTRTSLAPFAFLLQRSRLGYPSAVFFETRSGRRWTVF